MNPQQLTWAILRDGRWWMALEQEAFQTVSRQRRESGSRPLEVMGYAATFSQAHAMIVLFQQEIRKSRHKTETHHAGTHQVCGCQGNRDIQPHLAKGQDAAPAGAREQEHLPSLAGRTTPQPSPRLPHIPQTCGTIDAKRRTNT